MQNPLKKNGTYLRKKTDLLRDYLTIGVGLSIFGLFMAHQYQKINPPDPVDEPQYSKEYNVLDFMQDKIRKTALLKSERIAQLKQNEQTQN